MEENKETKPVESTPDKPINAEPVPAGETKVSTEVKASVSPVGKETKKVAPTAAPGGFGSQQNRGQGGQQRRRRRNESAYKKSLTEKQTLKRSYGLSEKQFRKYVDNALSKIGKVDNIAEELIKNLEKRLDNVVFRTGIAKTRTQARQLVSHGFFTVNGKSVNIPSYSVKKKDIIALKNTKRKKGIFDNLVKDLKTREVPSWISFDKEKLKATCSGEATLQEVRPPAEISQIFEFYSR